MVDSGLKLFMDYLDFPAPVGDMRGEPQDEANVPPALRAPEADDIKVQYHPSAGVLNPVQIFSFDDYKAAGEDQVNQDVPFEAAYPPWHPFPMRFDFELSELMLDAHMNKGQISTLLMLVNNIAPESTSFTIANFTHLSKIWEFARGIHTSQVGYYFLHNHEFD